MIYSRRLGGPLAVTTASTTIISAVPTGHVYVVRSITIETQTMAGATLVLLALNSTANANRLYRKSQGADDTVLLDNIRWVMNAGDVLVGLHGGTGGVCAVSAHGYDLTA